MAYIGEIGNEQADDQVPKIATQLSTVIQVKIFGTILKVYWNLDWKINRKINTYDTGGYAYELLLKVKAKRVWSKHMSQLIIIHDSFPV